MNQNPKSKPPVTAPQQSRSERTQSAILKVVEQHLAAGTFDRVSVHDLVSEAGCSVGAFYGRFANKAAALYRFYDQSCSELEVQIDELLDPDRGVPLATILKEFTHTIVYRTFANAELLRSDTLRREAASDSPFTQRAQEMNLSLLDAMQRCLKARKDEISLAPSHETALFVLALVGGLSRDAVVNGARLVKKSSGFNAEKFARELTRAVTGYLQ